MTRGQGSAGGMRWSAICREVRRDVATGAARTVLTAVALTALLIGLAAGEVAAVRQAVRAAAAYRDAGAAVLTLAAPGRVDGAACAALADLDQVVAAGAIRAAPVPLAPAALPRTTIPTTEVTSGLLAVLGIERTPAAGVVLSDQAVDALGTPIGSTLSLNTGSVEVTATYGWPADGRRPGYGYAALLPVAPRGAFDECWVSTWPVPTTIGSVLRTTLLPGEGRDQESPAVVSQLNTTLGARFDGGTVFDGRLTRFAPWLSSGVALVIGFLSVRSRRAVIAGLLHDGVGAAALIGIGGGEVASWVVPSGLLASSCAVIAAAVGPPEGMTASIVLALRVILPSLVAAVLGAGLALAGIRERRLMIYVRE